MNAPVPVRTPHHAWLRMRGNASGRTPAHWERKFWCDGCKKEHGPKVVRWGTLDGKLLCTRQFDKHLGQEEKERVARVAIIKSLPGVAPA